MHVRIIFGVNALGQPSCLEHLGVGGFGKRSPQPPHQLLPQHSPRHQGIYQFDISGKLEGGFSESSRQKGKGKSKKSKGQSKGKAFAAKAHPGESKVFKRKDKIKGERSVDPFGERVLAQVQSQPPPPPRSFLASSTSEALFIVAGLDHQEPQEDRIALQELLRTLIMQQKSKMLSKDFKPFDQRFQVIIEHVVLISRLHQPRERPLNHHQVHCQHRHQRQPLNLSQHFLCRLDFIHCIFIMRNLSNPSNQIRSEEESQRSQDPETQQK